MRRSLLTLLFAVGACGGAVRCNPSLSFENFVPPPPLDAGDVTEGVPQPCRTPDCRVERVWTGGAYTCARTAFNEILCFGDNRFGQLIPSSPGDALPPTWTEQSPEEIVDSYRAWVPTYASSTRCEMLEDQDSFRQRCTGNLAREAERFSYYSPGALHGCGVRAFTDAAGNTRYPSECGGAWNGVDEESPGVSLLLSSFESISISGFHSCGVTGESLFCWGGLPPGGVLAPGDWSSSPHPVEHPFGSMAWTLIGPQTVCVRESPEDGREPRTWCSGSNERHQLGLENRAATAALWEADQREPLCIGGSGAVTPGEPPSMEVFGEFMCGVEDQRISCWGANGRGQLGNGTLSDSARATPVMGEDGRRLTLQSVDCGGAHACAIDVGDGSDSRRSLWCWGDNSHGQLGRPPSELPMSSVAVRVHWPARQ